MTTYTIKSRLNNYTNFGQYAEQNLAYDLTNEIRKADHVPFYVDSDIPEFHMSVKSSGFTLASGKQNIGDTLEEKLDDFFNRVASDKFAYVSQEMIAYIMTAKEFRDFLVHFTSLQRDSEKNGGLLKVKANKESKKMVAWLNEKVGE